MRRLFLLKPADSLTILFLLLLIILSMVFYKKIPHVHTLISIYALLFLVQAVIIKNHTAFRKNRFMDVVKSIIFPVICVLAVFDSLEWLIHYINPRDVDPLLIRLDYLIFNTYPTVMMESIHNPILTDVLQVAYTTYYFLPISLGLILKLKGKNGEFDRTLFLILLCFYLSYIGYILLPALGPRYTINHLQSLELRGIFLADSIQRVLNEIEGIKRDAFPSGHTAVAIVVAGLAYRYHKGFFYITLPFIALLIFSTVYCRYHYAVDVLGGIILAAITFFIGEKYYEYWEVRNNTDH
ncbi:MAG: phosphatase PAP2 family protein [Thermodesulfovibrionales bacterium]